MSDFDSSSDNIGSKLSQSWGNNDSGALFKPDELDIYANKLTYETYIFHGKVIDYEPIDHLEYNPDDYSVNVVLQNGSKQDLGVKIQWMMRPYFTKAQEISIVRTNDGQSVDGKTVPLKMMSTDDGKQDKA